MYRKQLGPTIKNDVFKFPFKNKVDIRNEKSKFRDSNRNVENEFERLCPQA